MSLRVLLVVAAAAGLPGRAQPPGERLKLKVGAHGGCVTRIAFSPDGKRFLSGGLDETAKLWSFPDGKYLATLKPESKYQANTVNGVAFSPDGKHVALVTRDPVGWVFDADTGKAVMPLKGHTYAVEAVRYSPDGTLLATASFDNTARLWDARTGAELAVLRPDKDRVYAVAFSPDGKTLATAGWEGPIHLWDVATRRLRATLPGHTDTVHELAFTPDGKMLVSGGEEERRVSGPGKARVWDLATNRQVAEASGLNGVLALAVSPDGKTFAFAGESPYVKVVELATGKDVLTLKEHQNSVHALAFSPNGKTLLSGSTDTRIHFWDVTGAR